ncbi:MAG: hypothetical protein ACYDAY_07975 [Candidatus Dormibacteria bacterium]
MGKTRNLLTAGAITGSMVLGGVVGATFLGPLGASAATGSSPSTGGAAPARGAFHSNEDPAHEAGESAAREAAENSGQWPGPPPGAPGTPPLGGPSGTAPSTGSSPTN